MKKLFLSAAVLAMLASCQNEAIVEQSEMQQGGEFVSLNISKGSESRTALGTPDANGITPTVWSEGDKIYVCGNNGKVAGELKLVSGANETSGIFEGYVFGGKQLDYVVFPVPEGGKTINMAAREEGKLDAPMVGTISGNTTASLNNVGGIIAFPSDKVYDVRAMVGENNMTGGSYEFNPATGELTYTPGDANDLTPAFKPERSSDFVYVPVATAYIDNNGTSQTVTNVAVEVLDGEAVISSGNMAVAANEIKGDEEGETTLPTISAWDGTSIKKSWYDDHINDDTYTIVEAAELAYLAEIVNSKKSNFVNKTINLGANIDLNNKDWTPIGNVKLGKNEGFLGTFDGCGFTINNLSIKGSEYLGLFGSVNYNGTNIKNLTLTNVTIVGHNYAGPLVGYSLSTKINNCTVNGCNIKLTTNGNDKGDKAGGIVGYAASNEQVANVGGKHTIINNCTVSNVTITAYEQFGGIVGCAKATKILNNKLNNVTLIVDNSNNFEGYTTQDQHLIGSYVGRIVGDEVTQDGNTGEAIIKYPF